MIVCTGIQFFVPATEPGFPAPAGSKSAFPLLHDPSPPTELVAEIWQRGLDRGQIREKLRLWVKSLKISVRMSDSSKYQGPWQALVAARAAEAMTADPFPREVPLSVKFDFVLRRSQAHHEGNDRERPLRPEYRNAWPCKVPDALKLARAVEDAMTGIVYVDDCSICQEMITKRYGDEVGVWVKVSRISEDV